MPDYDVAKIWDANAAVWTRHVRAGYDVFRDLMNNPAFFAFVGDLRGQDALDAGCGEGYNTRLFALQGARMAGIDLSAEMIANARIEEARAPLGIRYEVASMAELPFADAAFDAVVSTMALMDCDCYEEAIREFHRVLRPGGLLAFSLIHPCFSHMNIRGWEHNEAGEIIGMRMGAYFNDREAYTEQWRFNAAPDANEVEPFTITYFDRTLAELLNPLCAAGFRLEGILEVRPSEEACRVEPRLAKHRLIPQSLCVKARQHPV